MLNSEIVSRIKNHIKAYTKDAHVSGRWIIDIAKTKATTYTAQKLGEKTVLNEDNLFSYLNCFELEPVDIVSCDIVEFRTCTDLMRSKVKLPESVYSRLGNSVISVTSLDGKPYTKTTLSKFQISKDRNSPLKPSLYYVSDGYLYLPNSTTEVVDVVLLALDKSEVDEASSCSDCPTCKSYWDYEFVVSDKLLEPIIQATLQEVLATLGIVKDENPNLTSLQRDQVVQ